MNHLQNAPNAMNNQNIQNSQLSSPGILELVKNPRNINKLLYNKYGDITEDYMYLNLDALIYSKNCHVFCVYKEYLVWDYVDEFLKRFYSKDEAKERLPKIANYYKNYLKFFCNPFFRDFKKNDIIQSFGDNKAEIYYKMNYGNKNKAKTNVADENINSLKDSSEESCGDDVRNENENMLFNTSVRENIDKNIITQTTVRNSEANNSLAGGNSNYNNINNNMTFLPDGLENDMYLKTDLLTRRSKEESLLDILNNLGEDVFANMNKRINDRFINKINKNNSNHSRKPIKESSGKKYNFSTVDKTKGDDASSSIKNSTGGIAIKGNSNGGNGGSSNHVNGGASGGSNIYKRNSNNKVTAQNNNQNKVDTVNINSNIKTKKNTVSANSNYINYQSVIAKKNSKERFSVSAGKKNTTNSNFYKLQSPKNDEGTNNANINDFPSNIKTNRPSHSLNFNSGFNRENALINAKNKVSLCSLYKVNPWNKNDNSEVKETGNILLNSQQVSNIHNPLNTPLTQNTIINSNTPISCINNINFPTGASFNHTQTPKIFNGSIHIQAGGHCGNGEKVDNVTSIGNVNSGAASGTASGALSPKIKPKFTRINEFRKNKPKQPGKTITPSETQRLASTSNRQHINSVKRSNQMNHISNERNTGASTSLIGANNVLGTNKYSVNYSIDKKIVVKNTKKINGNEEENSGVPVQSGITPKNLKFAGIDKNNNYSQIKYTKIPVSITKKTKTQNIRPNSTNLANNKRNSSLYNTNYNNSKHNFSNSSNFSNANVPFFNPHNQILNPNLFQTSRNIGLSNATPNPNLNSMHINQPAHRYSNSISQKLTSHDSKINNYINLSNKLSISQNSIQELHNLKTVRKSQSIDKSTPVTANNLAVVHHNNSRNKNQAIYKFSSNPMNINKTKQNKQSSQSQSIDNDISKGNTVTNSLERTIRTIKNNAKSPMDKDSQGYNHNNLYPNYPGYMIDKTSCFNENNTVSINSGMNNINNIINGLNEGLTHKIKTKLQDFLKNQETTHKKSINFRNEKKTIKKNVSMNTNNRQTSSKNDSAGVKSKSPKKNSNRNLNLMSELSGVNSKLNKNVNILTGETKFLENGSTGGNNNNKEDFKSSKGFQHKDSSSETNPEKTKKLIKLYTKVIKK